ncbi:HAD family hydrolase [Kineococcus rhizosphaerae]|uniref:Phosphoglycolate phosphatase-like HAD superfamily hydrolase n=1 Tax=Kineococcus rhizosphaerae TaxID=559628 RepID=A0A2T0R281_9ACTN|nr:HAD family hydrolase [Kineococcus rhizosphaerae]PRY13912.1 phosphoglycolate phosphatase-like HAD superfamily hydrolase [Kineococcus rhizosphaerae]
MPDTAVLDVDGTLVDTNYQHALAWFRAFRRFDLTLPVWRLHRAIGMGGDQLVPAVAGQAFEAEHGDAARQAWSEEFDPLLPEVQAFEGAQDLLTELKARGFTVVLASSGQAAHVDAYLDLLDARELCDAWTTSEDAESTKPAPDLLRVALEKVSGRAGVLLGDSTWDCEAAANADMPAVAVRTGGFSVEELTGAGAGAVFDSLRELLDGLDGTEFARPS